MKGTLELNGKDFARPENAFEKYADTVYRLAFVRTKSKADSDDILQEVFLRYLRVWHKMQSEEHIKAMLLRITVNCSNSLMGSAHFKRTEALNDTLAAEECLTDSYVLDEVLKLPQKYRTAIHLHYYCGYSVEEIARIEQSKPSTVKTHLSRGRKILKNILKAEDL